MRLLFRCVERIHVIRRGNALRPGGFLLAGNHISHFDPFIVSGIVRRKIDWMAMAEFFPLPVLGWFLRAVDAFPADRHRADRATIRTAIERLKDGRVVGILPGAAAAESRHCARGCNHFRILGTSDGARIGVLLACVERDLCFVALLAPIVDVEHAIWEVRLRSSCGVSCGAPALSRR